MIVVKIKNGLGNQMFQYAAARTLADRLRCPLVLDVSWFRKPRDGTFRSLDITRLQIRHAFAWCGDQAKGIQANLLTPCQRLASLVGMTRLADRHKGWDERFASVRSAYLDGYWQNPAYFADNADAIRHDLQLRNANGRWSDAKRALASNEYVAVHVRRGDLVDNPHAAARFGCLPLEYYERAMLTVRQTSPSAKAVVFSDDLPWAMANLKPVLPLHPSDAIGSGLSALEELHAMSRAPHLITANSTFSWWAGWLGQDARPGIVITPREWFAKPAPWTKGLQLDEWIAI